ncbi:TPA: carbon-nitrogen hydrolase [bacterium UBP9_UBA11836]|nr:carbon-nitrogen hydrolase [bacterium UBP9_UBA11836]
MCNRIRILQAQMKTTPLPDEAIAEVQEICHQAQSQRVNLVSLPEMFCCPYKTESFPLYAEPEGGQIFSACATIAKKYKLYLAAGSMAERDGQGHIYNTAYVFNPQGELVAKHRKIHLFDIDIKNGQTFKESNTLSPGQNITVFPTEFGPIGLCICYDFRFPELGRLMALQGAQIVLVPAAFNLTTGPLHWELTFRSQAVFNQFFALGTAPARDLSASYHSWGHTIAVDPWGQILAELNEKEGQQIVDLDLNRVKEVRQQLPLLQHRRTDLYSLTLNKLN